MVINSISPLETDSPFDLVTWYPMGSKEELACTSTLHVKIGFLKKLSLETCAGVWLNAPSPKKGTVLASHIRCTGFPHAMLLRCDFSVDVAYLIWGP